MELSRPEAGDGAGAPALAHQRICRLLNSLSKRRGTWRHLTQGLAKQTLNKTTCSPQELGEATRGTGAIFASTQVSLGPDFLPLLWVVLKPPDPSELQFAPG